MTVKHLGKYIILVYSKPNLVCSRVGFDVFEMLES